MNLRRLLLTTDFSEAARAAYGPAADLARMHLARVDLVHAVEIPAERVVLDHRTGDETIARLEKEARRKLEKEAARPLLVDLKVETHLVEGQGAGAVCEHARRSGADLIVQTSHGFTGWRRLLLGSFAEQVLRLSTVPVLTVKERPRAEGDAEGGSGDFRPRRILFPHDLSPVSAYAAGLLRSLAYRYGAHVTVLYAWKTLEDLPPFAGQGEEAIDEEYLPLHGDAPLRLVKGLHDFASRNLHEVEHEVEVVRGDAAEAILGRASEGIDLICMATHGWTGLRRLRLGSIAEDVVRKAGCNVLTARAPLETLEEEPPEPPSGPPSGR